MLHASQVAYTLYYTGGGMNNEILTNDTKETRLTGPPNQVIGNTQHVEIGKGYTRLKEVTVWGWGKQ